MKVCVIGASFAKAAYLPALRHVEGVELAGIASQHRDSAAAVAQEFGVPVATDDWRAMLNGQCPDLVLIATPTDTHAAMTQAAMELGAHVVCEKPTALNATEAKGMRDLADARGLVGIIDHELRFNPNRQKIRTLIRNGDLGTIRHVNIVNITASASNPASKPKNNWWLLDERGGGRLGANGSHQIDLVRFFFGEVAGVDGLIRTMVPDRLDPKTGEAWRATADDVTRFTLDMESGALVDVFISSVAPSNVGNTLRIMGSKASLFLDDANEILQFQKAGGAVEDISEPDPNASLPGLNKGIWNVSVVALLRDTVAAIRDKRAPHGATFEDGWRNQVVMDAVRQSSAERRWIGVSP